MEEIAEKPGGWVTSPTFPNDRVAQTQDEGEQRLRVAVIGSPRSGNTWLRGLLASIHDLRESAVHSPEEVDWEALPNRHVLQIHWLRDESFESLLDIHGFRVVVMARHPMDVLISSLNYEQHLPNPTRWTNPHGVERTLVEATPRSAAFIEYATANHPGSVLSFSPSWWTSPKVSRIRYEELIDDPIAALTRLAGELEPGKSLPIAEAVEWRSMERERSQPEATPFHFWQGRPGLWKSLITIWVGEQIAAAQREVFEILGYDPEADPTLHGYQSDAHWYRLQFESARRLLDEECRRHERTKKELAEALACRR